MISYLFIGSIIGKCSNELTVSCGIGITYLTDVNGYVGLSAHVSVLTASVYRTVQTRTCYRVLLANYHSSLIYISQIELRTVNVTWQQIHGNVRNRCTTASAEYVTGRQVILDTSCSTYCTTDD